MEVSNLNFFDFSLVMLSFLIQFILWFLMKELSCFFIFVLEIWMLVFVFFLIYELSMMISVCVMFVVFYMSWNMFGVMFSFLFFGSGVNTIVILFFMLVIKYGLCSSLFILYISSIELFFYEAKFVFLFYILNSKLVIVFYGWFLGMNNMFYIIEYFLDVYGYIFMFFVWFIISLISWIMLFVKDFENYLLNSFCMSQFILFFCMGFSFSLFFYCLLIDLILVLFFMFYFYDGVVKFSFCSFGSFSLFVVFFLICFMLGIPPFPGFCLEMGFLFLFLNSVKVLSFSFLFVIVFCFNHIVQMIYLIYFSVVWLIEKGGFGFVCFGFLEKFFMLFLILFYLNLWVYFWFVF